MGLSPALELVTVPRVEAFCDAPLPHDPMLHLRLVGGEGCVAGLVLEVEGEGLALASVEALAAWVPYGDMAWRVAPVEEDGALRFDLPEAQLEAGGAPVRGEALRGQDIEAIEARLLEDNRRSVAGALVGRGLEAGEGCLRIRVRARDRALASSWRETSLLVDPRPRLPTLPGGAPALDPEDAATLALCDVHDGADQLLAWFAFDDPLLAQEPLFWRWADALAAALTRARELEQMAATLRVPGAPPAKTTVGPEGLGAAEHEALRDAVSTGAALRLALDEGAELLIRDALMGDPSPTSGIIPPPLELAATVPQPETDAGCAQLVATLRVVIDQISARRECAGALICARGADLRSDDPLAYELLAGLSLELGAELRRRPRAPGWRVLVPTVAVAGLREQPGVRWRRVPSGALLGSEAPDPFSMNEDDRRAVEGALVRCFESPTRP